MLRTKFILTGLTSIAALIPIIIAIKNKLNSNQANKDMASLLHKTLRSSGINISDRNITIIVGLPAAKKEFILNMCTEYSVQTQVITNPTKTEILDEIIIATIHDNVYIAFIEKEVNIDSSNYQGPLLEVLQQVSQTNKFLNNIILIASITTLRNNKQLQNYKNTISHICKTSNLSVPVYVVANVLGEVHGIEQLIELMEYKYYFQTIGINANKYSVTPFTLNEVNDTIKEISKNITKLAITALQKKNTTANTIHIISIKPQIKQLISEVVEILIKHWTSFNMPRPPILRGVFFTGRFNIQEDDVYLFISDLLLKKLPSESNIINIGAKHLHQYQNKRAEIAIAITTTILTLYIAVCSFSLINHGASIKAHSQELITNIRIANQDEATTEIKNNAKIQAIKALSTIISLNNKKSYNILQLISNYILRNKQHIEKHISTKCNSIHNIIKRDVGQYIQKTNKTDYTSVVDTNDQEALTELVHHQYRLIYEIINKYNKLGNSDNSTLPLILDLIITANNLPKHKYKIDDLPNTYINISDFVQVNEKDFITSKTIAKNVISASINATNQLNIIEKIENIKDSINIIVSNTDIKSSIKAIDTLLQLMSTITIEEINETALFKGCINILDNLYTSKCINDIEYKELNKDIDENIESVLTKILNTKCKLLGAVIYQKDNKLHFNNDIIDLVTKLENIRKDNNTYRQIESELISGDTLVSDSKGIILLSGHNIKLLEKQLIDYRNLILNLSQEEIASVVLREFLNSAFDTHAIKLLTISERIDTYANTTEIKKQLHKLDQATETINNIIHICATCKLQNLLTIFHNILDEYIQLITSYIEKLNIIDIKTIVHSMELGEINSINQYGNQSNEKAQSIITNILNNNIPEIDQILNSVINIVALAQKNKSILTEIKSLECLQNTLNKLVEHKNNSTESYISKVFIEKLLEILTFNLNKNTIVRDETLACANNLFGQLYAKAFIIFTNKVKTRITEYIKSQIEKLHQYLISLGNTYPIINALRSKKIVNSQNIEEIDEYIDQLKLLIDHHDKIVKTNTQLVNNTRTLISLTDQLIQIISRSGKIYMSIKYDKNYKLDDSIKLSTITGNEINEIECRDAEIESFDYNIKTTLIITIPTISDALTTYQQNSSSDIIEISDKAKITIQSPIPLAIKWLHSQFGVQSESESEYQIVLNIPVKQSTINKVTANLETKTKFMTVKIKFYIHNYNEDIVDKANKIITLIKSVI